MDELSVKSTISQLGFVVGEISDIPLEDFIKQINFMLKTNKFNEVCTREVLTQFLILAQGMLSLKSVILMNFTAFEKFRK